MHQQIQVNSEHWTVTYDSDIIDSSLVVEQEPSTVHMISLGGHVQRGKSILSWGWDETVKSILTTEIGHLEIAEGSGREGKGI